jgi:hypothetical protein
LKNISREAFEIDERHQKASKYGIEEFLEVKYLCMGGIDR